MSAVLIIKYSNNFLQFLLLFPIITRASDANDAHVAPGQERWVTAGSPALGQPFSVRLSLQAFTPKYFFDLETQDLCHLSHLADKKSEEMEFLAGLYIAFLFVFKTDPL